MPEIKASPSFGPLLAVANALKKGREKLYPTGEGLGSAAGRFAVDALLPESIPKELENWSYGNLPLQMPDRAGGSLVPQFKKDRAESFTDLAMATPTPAKVAGYAQALKNVGKREIMQPINMGTLAKMEPDLAADAQKRAREASAAKLKGATPEQIWQDQQVSELRRTEPKGTLAGKWAQELPFTAQEVPWNKSKLMSAGEKMSFMQKFHPEWIKDGNLTREGQQFLAGDIPKLGEHSVGSLFDVSALRGYDPELEHKGISVFADPSKTWLGQYVGDANRADLNLGARTSVGLGPNSPRTIVAHELQHGVQYDNALPYGGSASGMQIGKENAIPLWEGATSELQKGNLAPAYADALRQVQSGARMKPFERYTNLIGEQQAEMAAIRSQMGKTARSQEHPGLDLKGNIDDKVWRSIQESLEANPDLYTQDPRMFGPFVAEALRKYR